MDAVFKGRSQNLTRAGELEQSAALRYHRLEFHPEPLGGGSLVRHSVKIVAKPSGDVLELRGHWRVRKLADPSIIQLQEDQEKRVTKTECLVHSLR